MSLKELKRRLVRGYARRRIETLLETEMVPCPLCGATKDFQQLYAKDRYGLPVVTVRCVCGFVFENPMPTEAFLNHFYSSHLFRALDWGVLSPTPRIMKEFEAEGRARKHLTLIEHLIAHKAMPVPQSLLDIGASEGTFIKLFRERFPRSDISAVEPGNFGQKIEAVHVYPSLSAVPAQTTYELITLWHVLEHVHDPQSFLQEVALHLGATGLFLIEVPDVERYGTDMRPIHIDHTLHFSAKTLTAFIEKCGMEVLAIHRAPDELMDERYGMVIVARRCPPEQF